MVKSKRNIVIGEKTWVLMMHNRLLKVGQQILLNPKGYPGRRRNGRGSQFPVCTPICGIIWSCLAQKFLVIVEP
jgi:hypothetical protein